MQKYRILTEINFTQKFKTNSKLSQKYLNIHILKEQVVNKEDGNLELLQPFNITRHCSWRHDNYRNLHCHFRIKYQETIEMRQLFIVKKKQQKPRCNVDFSSTTNTQSNTLIGCSAWNQSAAPQKLISRTLLKKIPKYA